MSFPRILNTQRFSDVTMCLSTRYHPVHECPLFLNSELPPNRAALDKKESSWYMGIRHSKFHCEQGNHPSNSDILHRHRSVGHHHKRSSLFFGLLFTRTSSVFRDALGNLEVFNESVFSQAKRSFEVGTPGLLLFFVCRRGG